MVSLILKSVHVKNFRSIKDETLYCEDITALIGANGSGKSTFLNAIMLFQNKSPKVELEDYYNGDASENIEIAVTFSNLSEEAEKLFKKYIQNDELIVVLVVRYDDDKPISTLHGKEWRNPDFEAFCKEMKAMSAKEQYKNLLTRKEYADLPPWSNHDNAKKILKEWESDNLSKCRLMLDDGSFFGFDRVAHGYLGKFVQFLHVPAVRDAIDDAEESKGSVLSELMKLVIKNRLDKKPEINAFRDNVKKTYHELMNPSSLEELSDLGESLSKTLQRFVPSAVAELAWKDLKDPEIKFPEAVINLMEDDYKSTVDRTGHGLQRALIMTMICQLSIAQASDADKISQAQDTYPTLVLLIEEPELYQHPSRQRHLANTLVSLAQSGIEGVSEKTQIIYCTHSSHFVRIDRIDQIRLLRKATVIGGEAKATQIFQTNVSDICEGLPDSKLSPDILMQLLQNSITPWVNEGFFSNLVVLVEGDKDRAAIISTAKLLDFTLDGNGISVVPCSGKDNLYKFIIIFQKLGIPTYVIWDSDSSDKTHIRKNHKLLKLMDVVIEDFPDAITKTFACFKKNMYDVICDEIGKENIERYIHEYEEKFSVKGAKEDSPAIISTIIEKAKNENRVCKSLEKIVRNIVKLNNHTIQNTNFTAQ